MYDFLILGGSGFIGNEILRILSRSKYKVLSVKHRSEIPYNVDVIKSSLSNIDVEYLVKSRIIFHLARLSGKSTITRIIKSIYGSRLNSRLVNILNSVRNGPLLVYFSGSLVYGSKIGEIKPVSFQRWYYLQEKPLNRYPNLMIIRPAWVIGKGSWFEKFYIKCFNEGFVPLYGRGDNIMSFITLKDCAELSIKLALYGKCGVYNLAYESYKQCEFAEILSEITGLPIKRISLWKVFKNYGFEVYESFKHSLKIETVVPIEHEFTSIRTYVSEILNTSPL